MSPYCPPSFFSLFATVVASLQPVAPNGWPKDREPPHRLNFSMAGVPTCTHSEHQVMSGVNTSENSTETSAQVDGFQLRMSTWSLQTVICESKGKSQDSRYRKPSGVLCIVWLALANHMRAGFGSVQVGSSCWDRNRNTTAVTQTMKHWSIIWQQLSCSLHKKLLMLLTKNEGPDIIHISTNQQSLGL